MIKFSSERDMRYGQVSQDILHLVQDTLRRRPSGGTLSQSTAPASPTRRRTSTSSLNSSDIDVEMELHVKQDSKGRAERAARHLKNRFRGIFRLKRSSPESERLPPTQNGTLQNIRQSVVSHPGFAQTMIEHSRSRHSGVDGIIPEELIEALFPLRDFDTIFVIDDSASMLKPVTEGRNLMTRWESLVRSIEQIGGSAAQIDDDGIDLHFINNRHKDRENIRSGKALLDIVTSIDWWPDATYLDDILQFILDEYLQKYRFYRKGSEFDHETRSLKPLNVIVISDGKSKDHEKVEATLVRTARALQGLSAPPTQVGVQFVQVGDDEIAGQWFRTLDDKLRPMYGVRDVSLLILEQFVGVPLIRVYLTDCRHENVQQRRRVRRGIAAAEAPPDSPGRNLESSGCRGRRGQRTEDGLRSIAPSLGLRYCLNYANVFYGCGRT
jgi:hypothetical protein